MSFLDTFLLTRRTSRPWDRRLRLEPLEPRLLLSATLLGSPDAPLELLPDVAYDIAPMQKVATVAAAADAPVVTLVATDAAAAEEGRDPGVFTVRRSVVTTAPLTVRYRLAGTAENGDDYRHISRSVTIPANEATATITVTPKDDKVAEAAETTVVTLRLRDVYSIDPAKQTATVTIADNEPVVTIEATDATAAEQGRETGVFTVRRSVVTSTRLIVHLYLAGTAENGDDYRHIPRTVVIPANQATATITVTPKDDKAHDPGETVVPTLTARRIYGLDTAKTRATVTITDNEQTVSIQTTDATGAEAASEPAVFTIQRTVVTAKPLVVRYFLTGTAENGVDYGRLPQKAVIPANQASVTVTVTPKDDTVNDPGETVGVTLVRRAPYGVEPTKASATVTITDNEQIVSIRATDSLAYEQDRNPGVFTVTRTVVTSAPLLVHYSVQGTATAGDDYDMLPLSVVIPANEATATITVTPVDDTVSDPYETVFAVLRQDEAFGIDPTRGSAIVTILDNES